MDGRLRSVLVTLSSAKIRRSFLQLKKVKGNLTVSDVPALTGLKGQNLKIYINERLPPATRRLYAEARRFVASGGALGVLGEERDCYDASDSGRSVGAYPLLSGSG